MISSQDALKSLREGNIRFVSGSHDKDTPGNRPGQFSPPDRQEPFAIILGCSDSRVPSEMVFDQGLGDLFVIRVAGNIVAPSQIGSVEFATEQFGTRLVVVLGHTMCGAIQATLEVLQNPTEPRSKNLHSIVNRISPSLESLLETDPQEDPEILLNQAMHKNVRNSVNQLHHQSPILTKKIDEGALTVVGAEYCMESGIVNFFD
ncbi:MAG: carbonic anhydrase [Verrucomicrobiales bacterium]